MSGEQNKVIAGRKLADAINGASSPEQILELLHEAAGVSGVTVRDNASMTAAQQARDASGRFAAVETKNEEPRTFVKTEIIGGREMTFESDSALGLESQIHQAHQVAQVLQESQNETEVVVPRRPSNPVAQVELELRFKRGEISASEYLQQSGAVDQYLESQGIRVQDLKSATDRNLQTLWADATQQFLESTPDWIGGSKNRDQIGTVIGTLGLVDSPSVESLNAAYAYMREKGLVFEAAPETIESAAVEAALKSTDSPQEILEAWKANLRNQGKTEDDVNDLFVRSHSKTGSGLFGR